MFINIGIFRILKLLLKDNSLLHLYEDFKYKLNSHPDFPTLKSISDTLEKFGFENTPVRLKPEELQELDSPFLAYIKDGGQYELTYAHHNSENKISYLSEKKVKSK